MKNVFILLAVACLTLSCTSSSDKEPVLDPSDYEVYLSLKEQPTLELARSNQEFWSKRLRPDSSGVGDLAPLAAAYEQLFESTGDPRHLNHAEALYKKGMEISANDKDAFARSLAHNYISQHRFKEAYTLLQKTLEEPSNKHETQLMLFDAAMEVGDYEKAYEYLNAVKNMKDYQYLIRLSKWSDHRGDLDAAIEYMEQAKDIADSRDNKGLKIWTYSNLADYYGHAGRIQDSYEHYLRTLQLQPDNWYVLKGIAWIAYSKEKNIQEAHKILDVIMKRHKLPDYHLLKADLYDYEGYGAKSETYGRLFEKMLTEKNYGVMYNTHLIELWVEEYADKALELALQEVDARATPETYHLLALAQLANGMNKAALTTIEQFVEGRTHEPTAAFHSALVYKANGLKEKVRMLKEELLEASYELGPLVTREVKAL